MTDLLFSTPWWLPAMLIIIGVALFFMGNQRLDNRLKYAGLGVVGLALLVALLSWLVETDREHVERRTRELVEAVDRQDWDTVEAMLLPRTNLSVEGYGYTTYAGRDEIISGGRAAAEMAGLEAARVRSLETEQTGPYITVHMEAMSEQDATQGRPLPSAWRLEWQRTPDGWGLTSITLIRLGLEQGPAAERRLPPP